MEKLYFLGPEYMQELSNENKVSSENVRLKNMK